MRNLIAYYSTNYILKCKVGSRGSSVFRLCALESTLFKSRPLVRIFFLVGGDLKIGFTLPETNSSHLKLDGWNTTFI